MAYKPSKRLKGEVEGDLNLNLNSMMDMFGVLIPALLMMSAVVEAAIINVVAPSQDSAPSTPPPQDDKPPLNLTVTVVEGGFFVSGSQGLLTPDGGPLDIQRPASIPIVEKMVACSRFRGTHPPPRDKNRDLPPCDEKRPKMGQPDSQRNFWVYDIDALSKIIIDIKDKNPEERRIIISPAKTVQYETLVDVMDATREVKEPDGELRMLFDEVIIGASL